MHLHPRRILTGLLIAIGLAPFPAALGQDTIDPQAIQQAPQRFWLKNYLFKDVLVVAPNDVPVDLGDSPHYAFETQGFKQIYANSDTHKVLRTLPAGKEYLFLGTVQHKKGRYYYTAIDVLDVKKPNAEVVPPSSIDDATRQSLLAIRNNEALGNMLYQVQAAMLLYCRRNGIEYKELFTPESPHSLQLVPLIRGVVLSYERTEAAPADVLSVAIRNALETYYGDPAARSLTENLPPEAVKHVEQVALQQGSVTPESTPAPMPPPSPAPAPAPVPVSESPAAPAAVPPSENPFPPKPEVKPAAIQGNEPDDVLEKILANTAGGDGLPGRAPKVEPAPEIPAKPAPEIPAAPIAPDPEPEQPGPAPAPEPSPVAPAPLEPLVVPEPAPPAPEPVVPAPMPEQPKAEPPPVVEPEPAIPVPAEPPPSVTPEPIVAPAPAPEPVAPAPMPEQPKLEPPPVVAPESAAPAPAAEPLPAPEKTGPAAEPLITVEELDKLMKDLNLNENPAGKGTGGAPMPAPAEPAPPADPEPAKVEPAPAPEAAPAPSVLVPLPGLRLPGGSIPLPPKTEPEPEPAPFVPTPPAEPMPEPAPVVPAPVETPPPTAPNPAPVDPVPVEPPPSEVPAAPTPEAAKEPAPEPPPVAVKKPKTPPLPKDSGKKPKEPPVVKTPPEPEQEPAPKETKPSEPPKGKDGYYDPGVDFHFRNLPK